MLPCNGMTRRFLFFKFNPNYVLDFRRERSKRNNSRCSIAILTRNRGHYHGEYQNSETRLMLK